jgi:hypothetical protein
MEDEKKREKKTGYGKEIFIQKMKMSTVGQAHHIVIKMTPDDFYSWLLQGLSLLQQQFNSHASACCAPMTK